MRGHDIVPRQTGGGRRYAKYMFHVRSEKANFPICCPFAHGEHETGDELAGCRTPAKTYLGGSTQKMEEAASGGAADFVVDT